MEDLCGISAPGYQIKLLEYFIRTLNYILPYNIRRLYSMWYLCCTWQCDIRSCLLFSSKVNFICLTSNNNKTWHSVASTRRTWFLLQQWVVPSQLSPALQVLPPRLLPDWSLLWHEGNSSYDSPSHIETSCNSCMSGHPQYQSLLRLSPGKTRNEMSLSLTCKTYQVHL